MVRASKQIIIFLFILNSVAGMVTASGLGAALEIEPEVFGDEEIESANQSASEQIEPGRGTADTLFSMFTSIANTFKNIVFVVFYGPMMLMSLGIPGWIVTPVFSAATIVVAMDIFHVLTGRDT